MRNILLILEYEGTNYHGWQMQKNALSIQSVVESALETILREPVRVTASGRTDAGVHALNQPVNFRTNCDIEPERLLGGLNAILSDDIVAKFAREVPEDFDARRSAKSKRYRYVILNRKTPSALDRHRCWHIRRKLDVDRMAQGAKMLVGEHDFSSFRASGCGAKHPVRKVLSVSFFRGESPRAACPQIVSFSSPQGGKEEDLLRSDDYILFEIEAHAFLKQMVRNIVGTLVDLGSGKIGVDEFRAILEARDRKRGGVTAPPEGLFLQEVRY